MNLPCRLEIDARVCKAYKTVADEMYGPTPGTNRYGMVA